MEGGPVIALASLDAIGPVLDALPSPVFIKEISGRFLSVNRAYEDVTGHRRELIVGKTVYDLYPKADADRYEAADRLLYSVPTKQVYEVPLKTAAGVILDCLVSKTIFRDERGAVAGLIGVFSDLSELRRVERALRDTNALLAQRIDERTEELAHANALLSATLESTADGILAVDSQRKVFAYNERFLRLWGIDPILAASADDASLVGAVVAKLRDPAGFAARVEEIYAEPELEQSDVVDLKNGTRFERHSLPLRLAGKPSGRVWSFRDVTRERQLELEMRHAQKMEAVGRLAGGVAHDFNNLLTVILANTAFVAESLGPDHGCASDVEEIRVAAERATNLTRQLLTFSRKQVVQAGPVDLNRVLHDMNRMLGRLLGEDIAITMECDPGIGCIRADAGQIEQVIANLSVNARDAMPRGGSLVFSTMQVPAASDPKSPAHPNGAIELRVADTGTGMSDEVREHIFEPFFTTKELGKGTGLGLSTVFGIVTTCGGTIEVRSRAGAGTTFCIIFPRDSAIGVEEKPARVSERRGDGNATILLVEDEASLRRALSRELRKAGYRVVEAGDGEEAETIARAQQRAFDLLVTDIIMPRKSGAELAEELLRLAKVKRVLFVSGFSTEEDKLPPDADLLSKPFAIDVFIAKVQDVLTRAPD